MSDNNSNNSSKPALSKIKSSLFERSFSVAKMGLNLGLKYAASKASGQSQDDFLINQAKYISSELGELKGSLMKAGQMLSMFGEYFFPPQANEFLKTLQTDSPPVEWSIMKAHLESYLPSELIDELEIDPVSLGTASMGQVHKATIKNTGEKIALKIQYPHLEKAIDSDIKALKTLLQFSKIIPSELDLDPVLNEVKFMLRQELNYEMEADLTEKYKALVEGDQRFIVPKVYRRYSGHQVLATEYLEGFKADHPLVQGLSQNRRNRLAENFIELYFKELFLWNNVQTDPHLGNYKIQIDSLGFDRIVLLDFGATRTFESPFIDDYRNMIQGSIQNNKDLFIQASKNLGFIIDKDSDDYIKVFESYCYEIIEPFMNYDDPRNNKQQIGADGCYHWKNTDLPSRVVKKAYQFKNFDLRTPPKDILFLDRKTGGVFIFLSVLKAHINARKIVDPFFKSV